MKHSYVIVLWIILGVAFVLKLVNGHTEPDKEIHLISDDFAGQIFILFKAKQGQPSLYDEQGHRVYNIPSSGLMFTQFPVNEGHFSKGDIRYFSVDANNHRKEITAQWHRSAREMPDDIPNDKMFIFPGGIGVMDLFDIQCHIVYEGYYIGTKNDAVNDRGRIDLEKYFYDHPDQCPQQVSYPSMNG